MPRRGEIDEVWETLAELFGAVAPKTNAHSKRNKACTDLKRMGATAHSVQAAARSWPRLFEGATLTDMALATHYPQLHQLAAKVSPPCPECGIGGGYHALECTRAA